MRTAVLWILMVMLGCAAEDDFERARKEGARLEGERDWNGAATTYERALSPGQLPEVQFWLLTTISEMYFNQGDYRAARRWLRQAESSLADRTEENAEGWVRVLNAKGALALVEGKLSAAEESLTRAFTIAEGSAQRQALAGTLHNLASVEMQTGRLALAGQHEKKALTLWKQLGSRHEYVLRGLISLSSIQALQHDWHGAEESLREALGIAETSEALSNYAVVLDHLKRGKEAAQIRRRISGAVMPHALIDVKAMGQPGDQRVVAR